MNTLKSNLDTTDRAILRELQADARLSFAEIGRRVGLSSPAVQERVRKMEDAGIIRGYSVQINHKAVGLPILAITRLMNIRGKENILRVRDIAISLPQVIRCDHVTGQDEFIVQIVAESIENLEDILHHFSDLAQLITSIVINSPVDNRAIDPQQLPGLEDKDNNEAR